METAMIDTALEGRGVYTGKTFFFKGNQYVRYDWGAQRVDPSFPQSSSLWNLPGSFAQRVDAALNGDGPYAGKAYFFRGNQYARYDWSTGKIDPGFPASLDAWHLPAPFSLGIDAAWSGRSPHLGKAYFIKGSQYVRYDWATGKVDPGYPAPLANRGLPGGFSDGVKACADGEANYKSKAYFFRFDVLSNRNSYVQYDWKSEKGDSGYPRLTGDDWKGIIEMLGFGLAKNVALSWRNAAVQTVQQYALFVGGTPSPFLDVQLTEQALLTHFHINKSLFSKYVAIIQSNYSKVGAALNNSGQIVRFRTNEEAALDKGTDALGVPYPGYTIFNTSENFTSTFRTFGPLCQAAMVLHEPVHYVDVKADIHNDFYEHSPQYSALTPDQAVHNPSSYVCFAEHIFYKEDRRYGAGRPNE